MAERLTQRMIQWGIIREEEQDCYKFGIQNGMIMLLNIVTAMLIGLVTNNFIMVGVFIAAFMTLRSYSGGYHADNRISCYFFSSTLVIVFVYAEKAFCQLPKSMIFIIFSISSLVIWVLCPMDSRKKELDGKEYEYFGKKTKMIESFFILLFLVTWKSGNTKFSYSIFMTHFLIAALMIMKKIQSNHEGELL